MVMAPTPPGTGVMAPATFGGFVIGDIAYQFYFALARIDAVDTDIDHSGAWLDPICP